MPTGDPVRALAVTHIFKKAVWIAAILLPLLALFSAACANSEQSGPEAVVREYLNRFEKFDTAGMEQLACPSVRERFDEAAGAVGFSFGLFDILFGLDVEELKFEDLEFSTSQSGSDRATVHVRGRLLGGMPFGSTEIDDDFLVARESGQWCVTAPENQQE